MIDQTSIIEASYFTVALVISICTLVIQLLEGRTKKRQNIIFIILVLDLIISTAGNVLCAAMIPNAVPYSVPRFLYDLGQYIYFVFHVLMAPLFYSYIRTASDIFYRQKKSTHILIMLPCAFTEVLVLLNPLTHWVYVTDDRLYFSRGWGEYVMYLAAAYYFILAMLHLFVYRKVLAQRRRRALIYTFSMVLVGVLLQLFFPLLRVELLFESLGLMGALLHIEKEDDRLDALTGSYNRNALGGDISQYCVNERSFLALCIRINDSDILRSLAGTANMDLILRAVAEELKKFFPSFKVYRAGPSVYMILATEISKEKFEQEAQLLLERFRKPFPAGSDSDVQLNVTMLLAAVPEEFSGEDVFLLSDGELPPMESGLVQEGEALQYLKKRVEMEAMIARAFQNNAIEVYYEPVYDWRIHSMSAAQATLRFTDPRYGTLYGKDFLPLLQDSPLYRSLNEHLLNEVLTFLGSGLPGGLGLERLLISYPAELCMQSDFLSSLKERIDKYKLSTEQIGLCIQNVALVQDQESFVHILRLLKERGFYLVLDRYGTTDSGLKALGLFNYDGVSIDVSGLQESVKLEIRRSLLLNSIKMIKRLKMAALIQGIHLEGQLKTIEETDVDYVQGAYFSEPVSQNELITFLRATEMSRQEEVKAKALSEAKSSFLANMSHEIRTPINAILGMNEMILREADNEEIRRYAHDIERAGASLLSIINDVLDFSKIEAGSMEIVEMEYDFSSLIHDVHNMIRIRTEEKGLKLTLDVDERLPERLRGDEMRLRQILLNLMNNAVKYTEKGGITLRVRGGFAEGERILLCCDVIDTGIGIREEDQEKLFEKFQRFDLEQNRTVEGTGLGLSIAANLISMMGGEISVQSMYGFGSTFSIKVPQDVLSWQAVGNLEGRYRDTEKNGAVRKEAFTAPEAQILVVDDTHINLTVIRSLLKRTRIKIDTAPSGAECLSKIRKKEYDAIFLDYRMPEMDGSETLRRMRYDSTHMNVKTPVIVLTANVLSGAKEQFLSEGFDGYLAKPVDSAKLEQMLIDVLPPEKVILTEGGKA